MNVDEEIRKLKELRHKLEIYIDLGVEELNGYIQTINNAIFLIDGHRPHNKERGDE